MEITPLDKQILSMLADGMSTKQIAKLVYRAYGTVHNRIYRLRLGVEAPNTVNLVAIALRKGWIT